MEYIKNNVIKTSPAIHVEYSYTTADNVKIGASYHKKQSKWVVFIQPKTTISDSSRLIGVSDIDIVIDLLKTGKNKMQQALNI